MGRRGQGEPLRGSTLHAYSSYADFLGPVVAVRRPDGTVLEIRD